MLPTHALPLAQPWPVQDLPAELLVDPSLSQLAATQRWLEHETLVLLAEFAEELPELVQRLAARRA